MSNEETSTFRAKIISGHRITIPEPVIESMGLDRDDILEVKIRKVDKKDA